MSMVRMTSRTHIISSYILLLGYYGTVASMAGIVGATCMFQLLYQNRNVILLETFRNRPVEVENINFSPLISFVCIYIVFNEFHFVIVPTLCRHNQFTYCAYL